MQEACMLAILLDYEVLVATCIIHVSADFKGSGRPVPVCSRTHLNIKEGCMDRMTRSEVPKLPLELPAENGREELDKVLDLIEGRMGFRTQGSSGCVQKI